MESEKKVLTLRFIVRAGIFSAFAAILYIFVKFPVPFLPPFLEFHFDEVPVFIASFAYGPLMGVVVLIVKTLIKLPFTETLCVGELSDLIYSLAFILPAAFIYNKNRKFKSVIIGFVVGFISQMVVAFLGNIFVMIPFYMNLFGMDNPGLKDIVITYGVAAILPFNAIKNAAVILITLPTYKSLHRLIDKIQIK